MNVEGNYYDKHGSSNPIVKKLMKKFHHVLNEFVQKSHAKTVLDVGCGEGHTTKTVKDANKVLIEGMELGEEMVKKAQSLHADIHFEQGSIYEINRKDASYDLVLSSEVLEHLDEPRKGLMELKRISKRYVLVSVPNEPLWRIANMLRGSYLKKLGNTPGHVNHWSKKQLYNFLKPHFSKVFVRKVVLWNIAICIK